MLSRRHFLGLLAGAGTALAVGELLLPPRTFFLAPHGGWPRPDGDFTTANLRYRYTERFSQGWTDPRVFGKISELDLEAMLADLRASSEERGIALTTTPSRYLTSQTQWFLKTEHEPGLKRMIRTRDGIIV